MDNEFIVRLMRLIYLFFLPIIPTVITEKILNGLTS